MFEMTGEIIRVAIILSRQIPSVFPVFLAFPLCFFIDKKNILVCKSPPPPCSHPFLPFITHLKFIDQPKGNSTHLRSQVHFFVKHIFCPISCFSCPEKWTSQFCFPCAVVILIITARNRSCGKVMFSQACVIPTVYGGGGLVSQHASLVA